MMNCFPLDETSIPVDEVDTLIFDLGGVFIKLTGVEKMMEWTKGRYTVDELWAVWFQSYAVKGFETGTMDAESFAIGIINEYGLSVSVDEFLCHFSSWASEMFPGSRRLLSGLRDKYTLVSLSNTNTMHWDLLCDRYQLDQYFHHNFPSHEIGRIKPEAATFDYVLSQIPSPAHRVIFFDDTPQNIKSARSVGIHAVQVLGVDGLTQTLSRLGIA
jgi:putative hydrolase of the HAD superfamily